MGNQVSELTVRPLKAADVRTVARILGPQIQHIPSDGGDPGQVGRDLFARLVTDNMDDLWAWLADMAGMTAEQLDEQPLDAPIRIVQAIAEDSNVGPFAEQVRGLLAKVSSVPGTGSQLDTAGTTATSTG